MKTVCLYFQVHQPWRLKKYRFFNMGKDHNYLDDLLNRSIMQKVARQCYLPMNALLQHRVTTPTALFVLTIRNLGLVGFTAACAVAAWRSSVATAANRGLATRQVP